MTNNNSNTSPYKGMHEALDGSISRSTTPVPKNVEDSKNRSQIDDQGDGPLNDGSNIHVVDREDDDIGYGYDVHNPDDDNNMNQDSYNDEIINHDTEIKYDDSDHGIKYEDIDHDIGLSQQGQQNNYNQQNDFVDNYDQQNDFVNADDYNQQDNYNQQDQQDNYSQQDNSDTRNRSINKQRGYNQQDQQRGQRNQQHNNSDGGYDNEDQYSSDIRNNRNMNRNTDNNIRNNNNNSNIRNNNNNSNIRNNNDNNTSVSHTKVIVAKKDDIKSSHNVKLTLNIAAFVVAYHINQQSERKNIIRLINANGTRTYELNSNYDQLFRSFEREVKSTVKKYKDVTAAIEAKIEVKLLKSLFNKNNIHIDNSMDQLTRHIGNATLGRVKPTQPKYNYRRIRPEQLKYKSYETNLYDISNKLEVDDFVKSKIDNNSSEYELYPVYINVLNTPLERIHSFVTILDGEGQHLIGFVMTNQAVPRDRITGDYNIKGTYTIYTSIRNDPHARAQLFTSQENMPQMSQIWYDFFLTPEL